MEHRKVYGSFFRRNCYKYYMKEMILLFFYIKNGMIYKNIMNNFDYYVENAQKIKRIVKA